MLSVKENQRLTQVGPGTPMGDLMRRYWHPIGASAELDQEPTKSVRLLGESLVLYKDRSGVLGLIQESCPHRRVNLLYGIPEQRGLRCPYHGWLFDESGRCLEMPAEAPDSTFKDRVTVVAYPVQELGGLVFAYLGPEPAPLLPRWDMLVDDNFEKEIGLEVLDCNWLQCMENSVDPVHTEWLHGWLTVYGLERLGKTPPPPPEGQPLVARHLRIGFDRFEYGIIKRRILEGQTEENDDWAAGHPILFPNILKVGTGRRYNFQFRTPMDDTHTLHIGYFAVRPEPGKEAPKQERIPFRSMPARDEVTGRFRIEANVNFAQDVMAWITQGPVAPRHLERLAESDKGIILYRRLLMEQMAIVQDGGEPMNVFRDAAANQVIEIATEGKQFMTLPSDNLVRTGLVEREEGSAYYQAGKPR